MADGLARAGCGSVMRPERLERTNVFQRSPATGAGSRRDRVQGEKGEGAKAGGKRQARIEYRNKALLPPSSRDLVVVDPSEQRRARSDWRLDQKPLERQHQRRHRPHQRDPLAPPPPPLLEPSPPAQLTGIMSSYQSNKTNDLSEEEDWEDYVAGGYHPVHIGDAFSDGRYVVVRKLG